MVKNKIDQWQQIIIIIIIFKETVFREQKKAPWIHTH